ncbi:MAG: hypothetical protein CMQ20_08120 [Gammaproteobacteria bacterium]|nr:hypothetical protein [Gammaproteobacteria bacterium]
MPKPARNHQLNTAGLEADVMRFMAIIAFCLIAIMALVKKIEPTSIVGEQKADIARPATELAPAIPVPEHAVVTDVFATEEVVADEKSIPTEDVLPDKDVILSLIEGSNPRPQAPTRQGVIKRDEETIDADTDPEPAAMTFRFDPDKTFLHLLVSNQLQLYASTEDGFLTMDSDYRAVQASPAGDLFEVMPNSIPLKVSRIFDRRDPKPVYLVSLPASTRKDLDRFLDSFLNSSNSPSAGSLVIHRDGHISHEI